VHNAQENRKRWKVAGEVVFWVICYFWAVWIINALLPPKPAQSPFETFVSGQLNQQVSGHSPAQTRSAEGGNDLAHAEGILR
jgi:hypothetical protein